MNDIAQLVAKQIEAQVHGLVRERLATIIGELDTMLEERAHAHEMIVEMDHKIASRLERLRYSVANIMTPEATAAVPALPAEPPPEPVPVPPPTPCPPLPPADEPGPAPLKARKLRDALVEIAEANGGVLSTGDARKRLVAHGMLSGTPKQKSKAIGNALHQSPRFEKAETFGSWRLRPADAPPPTPRPRRRTSKAAALEVALIEAARAEGTPEFNTRDVRDKLMASSALDADPTKASKVLSAMLQRSTSFEKIGYGRWRLVDTAPAL